MTKALVCTMNTYRYKGRYQRSFFHNLYGDPEQYAYKLANDTFADKLPIHMNRIWATGYGFYSFISLDQKQQRVWYSNHVTQSVEFGNFVFNISTKSYFMSYAPESNQVYYNITNMLCLKW